MTETAIACCVPLTAPALDEDEAIATAQLFKALGDPARVRIVNLVATTDEPVCACELYEPLGLSQPTVSHHTKVLADAGLITGDKRGRWVWWRIEPERLAGLRDALSDSR